MVRVQQSVQQRSRIAQRLQYSREGYTMSRPVPLPRTRMISLEKTENDERCSSTPPSPTNPSKVCSTPPPVAPKKWVIKKRPEGSDSANGIVEIIKVVVKEPVSVNCKAEPLLPPPRPPKDQPVDKNEILDAGSLMGWWKDVTPWTSLCRDLTLRGAHDRKIIKVKAEHLYKAIQVYISLLCDHGGFLKQQTAELLCIADNLDKVSKKTKIAGITGGATTAVGGVAAAAGVILSPFTLGASLALTVVGVGVATAGGVTGASAAIANKVNVTQDKKKIEKTFQQYQHLMVDIQDCLKFINEGMEQLKQHDLSVLSEARTDSVRVARVVELATTGGGSAKAIEANSKACGLMEGFALGIDIHFTKEKNGQKLKKGHETKLAKKIRGLAENLNKALDELVELKDLFCEHCCEE